MSNGWALAKIHPLVTRWTLTAYHDQLEKSESHNFLGGNTACDVQVSLNRKRRTERLYFE